mgnify:CR=1 FL=1
MAGYFYTEWDKGPKRALDFADYMIKHSNFDWNTLFRKFCSPEFAKQLSLSMTEAIVNLSEERLFEKYAPIIKLINEIPYSEDDVPSNSNDPSLINIQYAYNRNLRSAPVLLREEDERELFGRNQQDYYPDNYESVDDDYDDYEQELMEAWKEQDRQNEIESIQDRYGYYEDPRDIDDPDSFALEAALNELCDLW